MSINLSNALKMAAIAATPVFFSGCYQTSGAACQTGMPAAPEMSSIPNMQHAVSEVAPEVSQPIVQTVTQPVMQPTASAPVVNVSNSGSGTAGTVVAGLEAPSQVNVGQEFVYRIPVSSYINDCGVTDLKVIQDLGDNLQIISSTPKANISGQTATWDLGDLDAGQKKVIVVKAMMNKSGEALTCAKLDYVKKICRRLVAVEPALNLDMRMKNAVLACERIPVQLKVSNTGTGTAKNVVVKASLPAGLTAGQTSWNVGDLRQGSSKTINFMASARRSGNYTVNSMTSANGGLSDNEDASVTVTEPVLRITETGPSKLFIGRNATYKVKVSNGGTAPAENLVVMAKVPANTRFVSSKGGKVSNGYVTWHLNPLAVSKAYVMSFVVKALSPGTITSDATAVAKCAKKVSDNCTFVAKGIPAILLEVVDVQDPVEIGGQEVYVISCTNQGSATATNIVIEVEAEDAQQLISGTGATNGRVNGKTIRFAPLASLGAKQKTSWKVSAKALKAGSIRFKVRMTSDQLTRPVEETEATTQY